MNKNVNIENDVKLFIDIKIFIQTGFDLFLSKRNRKSLGSQITTIMHEYYALYLCFELIGQMLKKIYK